jgi:SAM-dependent methyltransferase
VRLLRRSAAVEPQSSVADKRSFYSQPEISASYERQRFGGASGARVNARELSLALSMLPATGATLDVACGTGRLALAIAERGQPVVGVDYSPAMASLAASRGVPTAVGDAFALPFPAGTFDAVVALRFAFHYAELDPLLREMRRVARPGATLVFDTYSWSPRAIIPLGPKQWGGLVQLHPRREVARVAASLGLRLAHDERCFLFSPYLYRLAPLPIERVFEAMERHVPPSLLCRVFWQFIV